MNNSYHESIRRQDKIKQVFLAQFSYLLCRAAKQEIEEDNSSQSIEDREFQLALDCATYLARIFLEQRESLREQRHVEKELANEKVPANS